MATQQERTAPYAPAKNVIDVIHRLRQRGLPQELSPQELTRIGIPDGNTNRTLQALRFLNIIDEEGHRTQVFERLGRASTEEYPGILAEIIREAYRDVFTIVDPASEDYIRINDAFRHFHPEAQRSRMIMLFMGLCREAGIISDSSEEPQRRRTRAPTNKPSITSGARSTRTNNMAQAPLQAPNSNTPNAMSTFTIGEYYALLEQLLKQLPANHRWTQKRRTRWLDAIAANVDLLVEVIDEEDEEVFSSS